MVKTDDRHRQLYAIELATSLAENEKHLETTPALMLTLEQYGITYGEYRAILADLPNGAWWKNDSRLPAPVSRPARKQTRLVSGMMPGAMSCHY